MPTSGSDRAAKGILQVRGDGAYVLRFVRHIAHPPERVWRALTDPDELRAWFPTDIEGERKPGGRIRFVFRDDAPRARDMPELLTQDPKDLDGEFTEFDPPRLLAYTWGDEALRWELEPTADGCRLTFTNTFTELSGVPHPAGPKKKAARTAAGWDVCLAGLRALLDGGGAPPAGMWRSSYDHYVGEFDQM